MRSQFEFYLDFATYNLFKLRDEQVSKYILIIAMEFIGMLYFDDKIPI
jgi:hypothetical protein